MQRTVLTALHPAAGGAERAEGTAEIKGWGDLIMEV